MSSDPEVLGAAEAAIFDRWFGPAADGISVSIRRAIVSELRALDVARDSRPVGEGLPDVVREIRLAVDFDAALAIARAALQAGQEAAVRPATHEHKPEYPSSCTGCEHLAADLASRLPEGLLPSRAAVRPVEREGPPWNPDGTQP